MKAMKPVGPIKVKRTRKGRVINHKLRRIERDESKSAVLKNVRKLRLYQSYLNRTL